MKNKIIVWTIVLFALVICGATIFILIKQDPLTLPAPEPATDFTDKN